jgi:hypothetical protein
MKKLLLLVLVSLLLTANSALTQTRQNRYEVELFANPNSGRKDTREVNAVLIFGADSIRIESRRKREVLKEFKYDDIRSVEHSYRKGRLTLSTSATALTLAVVLWVPPIRYKKERHWLNVIGPGDFAVLKIENDNFRMIRNELAVRNLTLAEIDEGKK